MSGRDQIPSNENRGARQPGRRTEISQQGPPASTRKKLSMSASVATSPSPLKSADPQPGQQFPARQAKKASMSASVAVSPSPLKSAELMVSVASLLVAMPQALEATQRTL